MICPSRFNRIEPASCGNKNSFHPACQPANLAQTISTPYEKDIMLVVHVHVRVKSDCIEPFKQATLENARQSLKEPGVARFDVLQQQNDPTRFVLVEAYRTPDAPGAHKETRHYQVWRDAVAPMMAEPRSSVKFTNVFPHDERW
jgi:(4S)-4-hydroxy-5-phosphonooxypentane-2,3-dione isomerase